MEERNATTDILKTIEQEMDSDIHPLLKKILDNIKPIGIAIGGIVVAASRHISGVTSYQESQHEKAVSELGGIMILADRAPAPKSFRPSPSPAPRSCARGPA
jgi:glucose uptake protein GlcU